MAWAGDAAHTEFPSPSKVVSWHLQVLLPPALNSMPHSPHDFNHCSRRSPAMQKLPIAPAVQLHQRQLQQSADLFTLSACPQLHHGPAESWSLLKVNLQAAGCP